MQKIPLAIAVLLLLTLPALAHAQGNSAIDQYTEGVPNASGDSLDTSGASGGAGGSPPAGTPSEAGDTGAGGDAGAAGGDGAAVGGTGESGAAGQSGGAAGGDGAAGPRGENAGAGGGDASQASGSDATPASGRDEAAARPAADSDSGGIGALPIILAITLLAAVGYAIYEWMRRRPSRTISNPSS